MVLSFNKTFGQTPNWNAKFIVTNPSAAKDTVWIGCSEFGDNGYQDTLDIIDTDFFGPVSVRSFDDQVEDEFSFGTCTNLRKDVKGFMSGVEITYTLYALSNEYPIDNNFFISWDTLDFIYNESGFHLTYAYLESELGYLSGIDGYIYSLFHVEIVDGDTINEFSNDYTEMYPIDTITECSNGNWALKVNVHVFFNVYPVSISDNSQGEPFILFPNPVSSRLYIQNINAAKKINIKVYNTDGRLVFSNDLDAASEVVTLDLEGLTAGIYFVQINDSTRLISSLNKIVKL